MSITMKEKIRAMTDQEYANYINQPLQKAVEIRTNLYRLE